MTTSDALSKAQERLKQLQGMRKKFANSRPALAALNKKIQAAEEAIKLLSKPTKKR